MIHIYNLNHPNQPKHSLEIGRDFQRGGGHIMLKYLPTVWWTSSQSSMKTTVSHSTEYTNFTKSTTSVNKNLLINPLTHSTNQFSNSKSALTQNTLSKNIITPMPSKQYLITGGSDGSARLWCYSGSTENSTHIQRSHANNLVKPKQKSLVWEISSTVCSNSNVPLIDIEFIPHEKG